MDRLSFSVIFSLRNDPGRRSSDVFQRTLGAALLPLAVSGALLAITSLANASTIYNLVPGGTDLEGYAIVGLPGINPIHLSSGPLSITGNVAVGAGGNFAFDGGGTIHGTLYADPTAVVNNSSNITGGVVQNAAAGTTVAGAVSAADALATFANSEASSPTETFGSINNATTITGTGGLNVIDVTSGIQLSGGDLTITGGPNDLFIFDVGGNSGIQISGGTQFILNGVNPNQVLFYLTGSANNILQTSSGSNVIDGIFLAPNGGIQINGGTDIAELIAKTSITGQSNPNITAPTTPPTTVPEPAPVSLSLVGLVALGFCKLAERKGQPSTI